MAKEYKLSPERLKELQEEPSKSSMSPDGDDGDLRIRSCGQDRKDRSCYRVYGP